MKTFTVTKPATKGESDELALIEQAQQDSRKFQPLYERHYKAIFVFLLHRVGDKALTADLTSQVFLKALTNLKKFRYQGVPFSAWLYRIALNESNEFFRKTKRDRLVSIDHASVVDLYDELTSDSQLDDLHAKLPAILKQLTIDEIQLIELRFFEHRPFKAVAEILGITESHAKVKLYRLLEKMKKLFADRLNH